MCRLRAKCGILPSRCIAAAPVIAVAFLAVGTAAADVLIQPPLPYSPGVGKLSVATVSTSYRAPES